MPQLKDPVVEYDSTDSSSILQIGCVPSNFENQTLLIGMDYLNDFTYPFVVHEHDDRVFMLLRDMCLPPNLVTTSAHYLSHVKEKKKKKNDFT